MFIERIIKKAHKVEAALIRSFNHYFIKNFEIKIMNKIKLKLALRLFEIEPENHELLNEIDETKRRDIIGNEWFKYNQWMRDPVLSECCAKVHWQLNRENYIHYTREYFQEIEKRVYMMRPEIMKKYYSHNN